MPDQEAIQRGRDFEKYIADKLGGKLQPGSGNRFFAKSDVSAKGLLISCKSENKLTWSKILNYLDEAISMAYQTGEIGTLIVEENQNWGNVPIVVMRLSDFVKSFEDDIKVPNNCDSKGLEKRSTAEVPLMLRD